MSNGAALILCFYILLRASMGLRFAAFMEGFATALVVKK